MKFSEEWWVNYAHPENRCVAHRKNGDQCRHPARRGATVCRVHGGAAPQVIAKARERISLAADRMARELLGIATGAESEAVKLAAVKDALDRAGLGAKTEVALAVKPWEDIMGDLAGVATITRAESRARRGLPDDTPAPAEPMDIVDAEVVDDDAEAPECAPDADGATRTPAEPTGVAADTPAPPRRPPSRPPGAGLQTLEDAAADANRATRVGRGTASALSGANGQASTYGRVSQVA